MKSAIIVLALLAPRLFAQSLPSAPIPASQPPPPALVDRALFTAFIGVAHGKNGFSPVGSVNFALTQHYGLYFAKSNVAYSGGLSFNFGKRKK